MRGRDEVRNKIRATAALVSTSLLVYSRRANILPLLPPPPYKIKKPKVDRLGLWHVSCSGYGRVTRSGGIPCSEHGVLDIVGNRGTTQALEWCDTVPRSREEMTAASEDAAEGTGLWQVCYIACGY